MTVGRVKDFSFPRSGPTEVRGYMRGGKVEKAAGGIVKPPASGIRAPRPASAVKAQKYVEGMAARPGRGPRVGAKLAVAKTAAPKMGALQNASTPMITPPAVPAPAMAKGGRMKMATGGSVSTKPDLIADYNDGYQQGSKSGTTRAVYETEGGPPPALRGANDRVGAYKQGLYDGARKNTREDSAPSMSSDDLRSTIKKYVGPGAKD